GCALPCGSVQWRKRCEGLGRSIGVIPVPRFGKIFLLGLFLTLMQSLFRPTRWCCAQVFGDSRISCGRVYSSTRCSIFALIHASVTVRVRQRGPAPTVTKHSP